MKKNTTERAADNIRIFTASMVEKAKSGHPGGAMGAADFINILYSEFLHYDPTDMHWFNRDRFFLDPGHMSPMLYSILALTDNFSIDELKTFRQWGSCTPGHPELDVDRGIENTSGPLGLGHTMAVGAAIAERFFVARFGEWMAHKTYTLISDGGIQEGISQGAGRLAGFLGLHNLIMFFDSNDIQLSTMTNEVSCENTAKKYEAWGWRVVTIDGNDSNQIREALKQANQEKEKPFLIIGQTIMGKGALTEQGVSFERKVSTHGQPLSKAGASFNKTVINLGGNPDAPWVLFPDVKSHYQKVIEQKISYAQKKKEEQLKWEKNNPELAMTLEKYIDGVLPKISYHHIKTKSNIATRSASGDVLAYFAKHIDNMIVMSADLANSDKTEGFLKNSKVISKKDFSGGFLHIGVSELTMAAIANGIVLHGGIFVACGTFFVFSDFMKPAIRMAALMKLPVKYVWTHDSFSVGEDGPTHQPIEQEAQIRLLEHVKNHDGKNSMLVLRPADTAETITAWRLAMENTISPTGLILSRQNLNDIPPVENIPRVEESRKAAKGAYIIKETDGDPDIILVANGSEVGTLIEVAQMLDKKGKKARVVSAISEGLFRQQDVDYQNKIIPPDKPVFGLTAGLPVNLAGLVGGRGIIFGLDHFGESAPAGILEEKFGFTAENILNEVLKHQG